MGSSIWFSKKNEWNPFFRDFWTGKKHTNKGRDELTCMVCSENDEKSGSFSVDGTRGYQRELRQEESLEKEGDNKTKCDLYQVGEKP